MLCQVFSMKALKGGERVLLLVVASGSIVMKSVLS